GETIVNTDLALSSSKGPSPWLWARTTTGKLCFIPPGKNTPVLHTGLLPPDAEFSLLSPGQKYAWVWSTRPAALYIVAADGKTLLYPGVGTAQVRALAGLPGGKVAWVLTDEPKGVRVYRITTALEVMPVGELDKRKVRALTLSPGVGQPVAVRALA